MKKTLSIIMAAVMLISCLTLGAFNAFAAGTTNKNAAPSLSLNTKLSITVEPQAEEDYNDYYFAKFTPSKTGCYEFLFDTKYTSTVTSEEDYAFLTAEIYDGQENLEGLAFALSVANLTEEQELALYEGLGLPAIGIIHFTAELKAGKTYYLCVTNNADTAYTTNVIVKTHKHTIISEKRPVNVLDDGDSLSPAGKYFVCKDDFCDYEELDEEYTKTTSLSLSKTKYTYDGKAKKPAFVVNLANGKKLSSKYYTVKYKNNKKVGKATATITFKGKYSGEVTKTFKIVPKGTELSKVTAKKKAFTAKWKKQASQTSGYEIQYARNSKFSIGDNIVTVKGAKKTSATVKDLRKGRRYYVRIRTYKTIKGKKYYSSWSKKTTVKTK